MVTVTNVNVYGTEDVSVYVLLVTTDDFVYNGGQLTTQKLGISVLWNRNNPNSVLKADFLNEYNRIKAKYADEIAKRTAILEYLQT